MAVRKFDGVVEAVRYAPDGKIELVRVYERRGPTFSDRVLLTRDDLIQRLKGKKRFYAGQRKQYLASTFDLSGDPLSLSGDRDHPMVVTGKVTGSQDRLEGVPLF